MAEGTIDRLVRERGFGFIRPKQGRGNVFFHQSSLRGVRFEALNEGDAVSYDEEQGPKGPRATAVRAVGKAQEAPTKAYRFLNPYNFVSYLPRPLSLPDAESADALPLWRCPPPPHDRYLGLSGRITCDVEAVTPVFVSDGHAATVGQRKHKTYRFFEYGGKPALPATTLRGAVRSVFEAVTNSCFSVFDGRRLSYRLAATRATTLVPARVEQHGSRWRLRLLSGFIPMTPGRRPTGLYAAAVHLYTPLKGRRSTVPFVVLHGLGHEDPCFALVEKKGIFTYVHAVANSPAGLPRASGSKQVVQGWLCINNQNVDNKRKERFFFRDPTNTTGPVLIDLPDPVRKAYEDLIRDYQLRHSERVESRIESKQALDRPIGSEEGLSRYMYSDKDLEIHDGALVYVSLAGAASSPTVTAVYAAPAAVPRVAYEHTTDDLLPYSHLKACRDPETLCPACRVFGWVRKDKEDAGKEDTTALAGRVRFSHAVVEGEADVLEPTTLAILSSPKPTTTRFYLRPKRTPPQNGLEDEATGYDGDNVLRGRKFYRHHRKADRREYERATDGAFDGKDEQNRTIVGACKPGTHFEFAIDFHNLMPVELGALLWALELVDGDRHGFHRVGFAKPLGFGSVSIRVTGLATIDTGVRYTHLDQDGWQPATSSKKEDLVKGFRETLGAMYKAHFDELPNVEDLMALVSEPADLPIHYPRTTRAPSVEGKNYEWFMGNKRAGRDAGPRLSLPLAVDDDEGLPILDRSGREVK